MAPFKFIERVYHGFPIQQYGDGTTSRDYTYIDDIVAGVVSAIDRPLGCEVINLGNGRPFLLKDFIALVERCVGKEALIEILPNQPGDVDRTCADITKARTLLGYSPSTTFEQGIARTSEWYKDACKRGLVAHHHLYVGGANVGLTVDIPPPPPIGETTDPATMSCRSSFSMEDSTRGDSTRGGYFSASSAPHSPYASESERSAGGGRLSRLSRDQSDLELSSFVEKASKQYKRRTHRIFISQEDENEADLGFADKEGK